MMPGDANTQTLTIGNAGTAQFRYAMTTAATTALGTALQLEVRDLGTNCATFDGDVVLAPTTLNGAAIGNPRSRAPRPATASSTASRTRSSASGSASRSRRATRRSRA